MIDKGKGKENYKEGKHLNTLFQIIFKELYFYLFLVKSQLLKKTIRMKDITTLGLEK